MRTRAAFAAALALAACAPAAEAPAPTYLAPDCSRPFEEQVAKLTAQPALVPAPEDPAEPYRFYSSEDGRTSYLITKPRAPGHPAIMMQKAVGADIQTTGCPWGDKAAYEQLHAYLDGLKHWRRK